MCWIEQEGDLDMQDHYYMTSDGVKLHYMEEGNSSSTVIVLPGMGENAATYTDIVHKLSDDYHVYVLDYRGHGLSENGIQGYHIERLAKDVYELLDAAAIGYFSLVCHGMGNAVAWCLFELYGERRVRQYVLEEGAPARMTDDRWNPEEALMYRGKREVPAYITKERLDAFAGDDEERRDLIADLYHDYVVRDWRREITAIQKPTLIVMGSQSDFAEENLWNWLLNHIKGSKLVTLEGGHDVHLDDEDGFVKVLKGFIR
jgi:pimeloyl-ACP methyl ester carboxylesterase